MSDGFLVAYLYETFTGQAIERCFEVETRNMPKEVSEFSKDADDPDINSEDHVNYLLRKLSPSRSNFFSSSS